MEITKRNKQQEFYTDNKFGSSLNFEFITQTIETISIFNLSLSLQRESNISRLFISPRPRQGGIVYVVAHQIFERLPFLPELGAKSIKARGT